MRERSLHETRERACNGCALGCNGCTAAMRLRGCGTDRHRARHRHTARRASREIRASREELCHAKKSWPRYKELQRVWLVGLSPESRRTLHRGRGQVGTGARGGKEAGPFGVRGGATGILERVLVPGDVAAVTWRGSAGVRAWRRKMWSKNSDRLDLLLAAHPQLTGSSWNTF